MDNMTINQKKLPFQLDTRFFYVGMFVSIWLKFNK